MDARLFWLALGAFCIGAEGFVVSSLLPAISADTGVTVAQGGTLVLVFALVCALSGPVLASLIGHWDRRLLLTISALVFTLGNLMAGFATSFEQLLISRAVMAVGAALYAPTAQATAVALATPEHRARAIAVILGGTTVAIALGAPLGALIGGVFGWRGTFLSIAGISLAATLAVGFLLPSGLRGARLTLPERVAVFTRKGVTPALLTTLFYMTGPFVLFTYIAPLAVEGTRLSPALLPAILLSFGVGSASGVFVGGQLADRIGPWRTITTAATGLTLMMAVGSLLPMMPGSWATQGFLLFMFVWGLLGWSFVPGQASRLIAMAPDAAPLVLSLNAMVLYLGISLGSVVGGQVLIFGTAGDLGWVGALFPLVALVFLLVGRPRRAAAPAGAAVTP